MRTIYDDEEPVQEKKPESFKLRFRPPCEVFGWRKSRFNLAAMDSRAGRHKR